MIKRLCFVATISKTIEWFMVDYLIALRDEGFEISIISNFDEEFVQKYKDLFTLYNVKMKRGIHPCNFLKSYSNIKRILKRNKFDFIQSATPVSSFLSLRAAKHLNVPIRVYSQWGIRYVTCSGIKRKILKSFEKKICDYASVVRSPSYLNMNFSVSEGLVKKDKIGVIGNGGTVGVDFNSFKLEKKTEYNASIRSKFNIRMDSLVFGFIGRLCKDKGIEELLRSFKSIYETSETRTSLMLVGMIDDLSSIDKELVKWAKNCGDIIFTGNIDKNDVPAYLSAFDVMVHPTYREGFGKVLQEGMALELPIITTNIPGPSEVVENGISALLVEPGDYIDLTNKMKELMSNVALREKLAHNGYVRCKELFEKNKMIENIKKDFYKLTNGK